MHYRGKDNKDMYKMTLKILVFIACVFITITEGDQGVVDRIPNTQVSTSAQGTDALLAYSDTVRPKDKSHVLKTGQKKTGCSCNGKKKGRLTPGKQCTKCLRARISKAVKKNPKKGDRNQRKYRFGRKKGSKNPISTPI